MAAFMKNDNHKKSLKITFLELKIYSGLLYLFIEYLE